MLTKHPQVNSAPEQHIEVVLPDHHHQPPAIAQVLQEEQEAVSNLAYYSPSIVILSCIGGLLVERHNQVYYGKYSTVVPVVLLRSALSIYPILNGLISPFPKVTQQLLPYLLAILCEESMVGIHGVVDHYFLTDVVGCDNEPVSIIYIDQKD